MGSLLSDLGKTEESVAAFRQAIALWMKLVAEFPAIPEYQRGLADAQKSLRRQLRKLGKDSEAEAAYREAIAVQEKLTVSFPTVQKYRQDLANTHYNLGAMLIETGNLTEGEAAHRQALVVRTKLVAGAPSVAEYRQDLAWSHNNLGHLFKRVGRIGDAEAAHREAMTIRAKLAGDSPAVPTYRQELAASYLNLGELSFDQGKFEASLWWYDKAVDLLPPVVEREPRLKTERLYLRNAHWGRATVREKLKQLADAIKDWDRAIELDDGTKRGYLECRRLVAQGQSEDLAKAIAQANALAEAKDVTAGTLYDLAGACALASAVIKDDAKVRDQYAASAVELLRRAVAKGYKDTEHLKKDDDLKVLREREDYQKLVKELEEKKQP
jgi:tetratricopeptide (TPR) repeat protein